jgi:hypothetical protein
VAPELDGEAGEKGQSVSDFGAGSALDGAATLVSVLVGRDEAAPERELLFDDTEIDASPRRSRGVMDLRRDIGAHRPVGRAPRHTLIGENVPFRGLRRACGPEP